MTEVKQDVHLEQSYKDNLKLFKNDLTLKPGAVRKQKAKPVKRSGPSNRTANSVERNGVTGRNQHETSTSVVQEGPSSERNNVRGGNQQKSGISSVVKKKRRKTRRSGGCEVVPVSTNENAEDDGTEEDQRNLPRRADGRRGLEKHDEPGRREVTNRQNNGARRSGRKRRQTKFIENGLV